jgi:hypothetical protein
MLWQRRRDFPEVGQVRERHGIAATYERACGRSSAVPPAFVEQQPLIQCETEFPPQAHCFAHIDIRR